MVGRGGWTRLDKGQSFNILMLEGFPLVVERGDCPASVEALASKLTFGRGSSVLLPNAKAGNRAVGAITST